MNYWLPGTVTYLSRQDWDGTYPINYNTDVEISISDSSKKDEWLAELRNQQHTVATNDPVDNVDGIAGPTFQDIGYEQQINLEDPFWDELVAAITVDNAVGAVAHGGSRSDTLDNINNPVVIQNDGPNGFNRTPLSSNNGEEGEDPYYVDPESEAGQFKVAINSQTLLGSSFNPDLALAWGRILGNSGLWTGKYQIWGGGLNYHRSPYNGRNTEYLSEDPMLTNRIGYGILKGTADMGLVCGPKHIGFNDQEHNRSGIAVYMNEQKFRQTDLRGFEGGLCEGGGLAVMVAFNRIGATNASHHVGMLKNILREEWGFTGVISTDLAGNAKYFNAEAMIMATVTQRAEFGGNNSYLSESNNHSEGDKTYTYISVDSTKNDAVLVNQAREDLKYQLYTFANSQVVNVRTKSVTPPWESALNGIIIATGILSGAAVILWLASSFINDKKEVK